MLCLCEPQLFPTLVQAGENVLFFSFFVLKSSVALIFDKTVWFIVLNIRLFIQWVCHTVLTQEKWATVTPCLTLRLITIFKPGQEPQIRNVRILSVDKFVLDEWMVRHLDIATVKIMAISLGIVWPFITRDVPLIRGDSDAPWWPVTSPWHWCCAHFLQRSTKWQNLKFGVLPSSDPQLYVSISYNFSYKFPKGGNKINWIKTSDCCCFT